MGTFRAVAAFGKPFVAVGGVEYLLMTVEVWSHAVFLTFGAEGSVVSRRFEAEHEQRMRAWLGGGRQAGDELPSAPTGALLSEALSLDDGTGTPFTSRGGSAGGTGTAWRVERMFEPGPSRAARLLTLAPSSPATALAPSPFVVPLPAACG